MNRIYKIIVIILTLVVPINAQIAYIRDGMEIRVINPDGTNDRRLWTHPDAKKALGIDSLAWRPDGKELVFSSRHAAAASLYDADLATRPGGGKRFRQRADRHVSEP